MHAANSAEPAAPVHDDSHKQNAELAEMVDGYLEYFDHDEDGKISEAEFISKMQEHLHEYTPALSAEEMEWDTNWCKEEFARVDTDGSGHVTYQELHDDLKQYFDIEPATTASTGMSQEDEEMLNEIVKDTIDWYDTNNDG